MICLCPGGNNSNSRGEVTSPYEQGEVTSPYEQGGETSPYEQGGETPPLRTATPNGTEGLQLNLHNV